MAKKYSIAQARHNLAAIVHDLEQTPKIELTRRGQPVAVLLSIQEYERLTSDKSSFWEAYTTFRKTTNLPALNIEPDIFTGVRDSSPGREINW